MVRLFVREVAEAKGFNMSTLQRKAQLPMSTMQRYWHSASQQGGPLDSVRLEHLDALCTALQCSVCLLYTSDAADE